MKFIQGKIKFLFVKTFLTVLFFLSFFLLHCNIMAQTSKDELPLIGAEIFIEPGQSPAEIDLWFQRMSESGMKITRIRMFEAYMHHPDGSWDFSLFDTAFKSAEKYNIKIYANLFPLTSFSDLGGFKFPRDKKHLISIAEYIKKLVTHFKKYSSLYGWVPINEPGIGSIPQGEFTQGKYDEWKENINQKAYDSKGYVHFDFTDNQFLLDYNTWFLKWLTDEIRKYDNEHPIHVNPHATFSNITVYNFTDWRKFLSSLGGSSHAAWHFSYFNRDQYSVAISANSEIIRSGAGELPWLMTEIQGGNNIYSGGNPMCPTHEEISQWLWTVLATESKGAIFWCLNPRASGIEAGEWALLNFQNEPSDRMQAISEVNKVINNNASLFSKAKVVESGINILYSRESLWIEKKLQPRDIGPYQGRNIGGVMKSALAFFEVLGEMGIQANLKEFSEFDFTKNNYDGTVIILSQQISIHSKYWEKLYDFVNKGGKLIVDGLTAYFDENAVCTMKTGFPFEKLFGGKILEFKLIDDQFQLKIDEPSVTLPAHMWRGTIKTITAKVIGSFNDEPTAVRNIFGKGEVIWIPTLTGLGSRITDNYGPLSDLLSNELNQILDNIPIYFKQHQPGLLMKTLQSGNKLITIIINKSENQLKVPLNLKNTISKPTLLFSNKGGSVNKNTLNILPEETLVVKWDVR